jgi:hypothetical protein
MPFGISNVSTVATIFILPMVVAMIVGRGASKPRAVDNATGIQLWGREQQQLNLFDVLEPTTTRLRALRSAD